MSGAAAWDARRDRGAASAETSGVSPAEKMKLPFWSDSLNRPSIELTADQAQKLGYTKGKVDTGELIWSGAPAG
jgi:hypothetical protein